LLPGDVIVAGTQIGVGAKRTPPLSVKAGEVSQIGVLRIPVVNELAHG
jgi:2-keto-4-pentenoate hydratase/2-oxohepta-3-ene-1,7-dioic acid hydratase in catechol pathway